MLCHKLSVESKMGIYGALATAVTGLRAQSFALENISGNIANSQTTGYKRIETSFIDLIPEAPIKQQIPGTVIAQSRSTVNEAGDIVSSSNDTYMAINGSGFFVVEKQIGQNDGNAIFDGASYYTRRGDFDINKEGYLVNGAGYFLKGLEIDRATGNVSGSVPDVIQLSNAFLPAQQTNRLDYQLNLPQLPKNAAYDASSPNSEIMDAANYVATPADITATATGAALTGANNAATVMAAGESLTLNIDGANVIFDFFDGNAGAYGGANIGIDVQTATPVTITTALAAMQTGLQASGVAGTGDATIAISGGVLEVTLGTNTTASFSATDGTTGLGLAAATNNPIDSSLAVRVPVIQAQQNAVFLSNSVAGGAVTVYASNGSPANVQIRWAKIDQPELGGPDRWNMFYMTNSEATGAETMWVNAGQDYDFDSSGSMTPAITSTTLSNLSVNGVVIGDLVLQHNASGVTQFADQSGAAQVTAMSQNGYPAGEFISVTINEAGRVVASYTNGQQIEVAQVVVANFNSPNSMKRLDGGLFAATSESGEAILDGGNGILGGALESSNTDISEEFTKLIVTQQAYTAGTRIVSTADEMLKEALNMVR